MSDEEYILLQDNRKKKSAGRGAYHKKGGSRSKGCRLPSDKLTAAQLKKLNGEEITVKVLQRIPWPVFKKMPRDAQRIYITELHDKYEARQKDLAEMMGVNNGTLNAYVKKYFADLNWSSVKSPSPEWNNFLQLTEEEPKKEITEPYEEEPPAKEEKQISLCVENGCVRMTGAAEAIFTKMLLLFDSNKNYDITVAFVEVDKYAERTA